MFDWRTLVLFVAIFAGCAAQKNVTDAEAGARLSVFVPTEDVTLARELYGGMTARERLVVRDPNEWPATWARIHGAQNPPADIVQPDFSREMAVVAAMGEKSSGGFEIVIDSVTQHERGSVVYVTERSPGTGCMTTGALTQPVHAVRAPRTDGTTWWRERSIANNC
jgi:hypothetical protein